MLTHTRRPRSCKLVTGWQSCTCSTAVATIATVTAALESTWGQREVTKKQAISSSYWFVADDENAHTRFFVIQGSNNIDHWRINLQFDPVTFEDPAMGLKVRLMHSQQYPQIQSKLYCFSRNIDCELAFSDLVQLLQ